MQITIQIEKNKSKTLAVECGILDVPLFFNVFVFKLSKRSFAAITTNALLLFAFVTIEQFENDHECAVESSTRSLIQPDFVLLVNNRVFDKLDWDKVVLSECNLVERCKFLEDFGKMSLRTSKPLDLNDKVLVKKNNQQ